MNRSERAGQNFIGAKKMIQICSRVISASVTLAIGVDRREVFFELCVFDVHSPRISEKRRVSRLSSWRHAVKSVDSIFDTQKQIGWLCAHSEQVSRLIFGQSFIHPSQDFWNFFGLKNPANSETVKVFRTQKTRTFAPKIFFTRALNHGKKRLERFAFFQMLGVELVVASQTFFCPKMSFVERRFNLFAPSQRRSELIKSHMNVRADFVLKFHRNFRRHKNLLARNVRFEPNAVVANFRQLIFTVARQIRTAFFGVRSGVDAFFVSHSQRKNLKTTAVGKSRSLPIHKFMNSSSLFQDISAGAEH